MYFRQIHLGAELLQSQIRMVQDSSCIIALLEAECTLNCSNGLSQNYTQGYYWGIWEKVKLTLHYASDYQTNGYIGPLTLTLTIVCSILCPIAC